MRKQQKMISSGVSPRLTFPQAGEEQKPKRMLGTGEQ
jgi:hypothetical protein